MSDPRWPDDGPTWPERDLDADDDREFWPRDDAASGRRAEPQPPPAVPPEAAWDAPDAPGDAGPVWDAADAPRHTGPAWDPDAPRDTGPAWDAPDVLGDAVSEAAYAAPPDTAPDTAYAAAPDTAYAGPVQAAPEAAPNVESGEPSTAFNGSAWDPKLDGERRRPTTAEQAVPWMIGVILALAGIVIVLLALIFTTPEGLIATTQSPSPSPPASPGASVPAGGIASAQPSPDSSSAPSPSAEATSAPTPTPQPEFGPLEMVYLGRPSALEPIYLLRRDFSEDRDPRVMAQADAGISSYAWAPDGTVGTAITNGRLVALTPGKKAQALADDVATATFGWDAETVYAVRILADGADQIARVIQIDFATGESSVLGAVSYPRPVIGPDPPLKEAQFIDNGGLVRLYPVADGNLTLWVLGAPTPYRVDPGDGSVSEADRQPILWSPDGNQRVEVREKADSTTDLTLRDASGDSLASVEVNGLVSHVRWARTNNEIVFTLGQLSASGGVRQDLWVWDLVDGKDPMPLTSDGVSFGAEWLGAGANWLP